MELKEYNIKNFILRIAAAFWLVSAAVFMFLLTNNIWFAAACLLFQTIGALLLFMQHKLNQRFCEALVLDLSILCENLITLQEKKVFPDNQDTVLSKLQNRILKLAAILKSKEADARKSQEEIKSLVSDLSHQLKTPMANLKMYIDFLDDAELTKEQRKEYLEMLRLSVERLSFLTEHMIKLSRLESGLVHLRTRRQSLNQTILKAIKDVFEKANNKGIELTYEEKEEIIAQHDRQWTAEAVFNLLDNAVKYSAAGSVISVSLQKLGMFAAVAVSDQADVISEEESPKIFQRFYRGKNSVNAEGIGVGLYLAREIVKGQGGFISLKPCSLQRNAEQKGNCFTVFLPLSQ